MSLSSLMNLLSSQDQRPRTDWDVAADLIRMAAMAPLLREERGYQLLSRLMPFFNAVPEEQRAEWWSQNVAPLVSKYKLAGVPAGIPSLRVMSFADLGKIDPALAEQFAASIRAAVAQSVPAGATPDMVARAEQNIQTILSTMPLRVWQKPDGGLTIDTASYSGILERLPSQAVALAGQPGMYRQNAREFLVSQGLGGVVNLLEKYPEGRLMLASEVDLANRQGFLANMGAILTNRADNLIRTVDTARQLFAQNPSYVAYKDFKDLVSGVAEAARSGLLGPDGAAFLRMSEAAADWIMRSSVKTNVRGADGKVYEVLRRPEEAEQYVAALTNRYLTLLKPIALGIASERNPARLQQLVQQKDAIIREATELGVPLKPIYAGYYNAALQENRLAELQVRERELAIAQAREAIAAAREQRAENQIQRQRAALALKLDQLKYKLQTDLATKGPEGLTEGELMLLGIDRNRPMSLTEAMNLRSTTSDAYSTVSGQFSDALKGRGSLDQLAQRLVDKFNIAIQADIVTAKSSGLGRVASTSITQQLPKAIREYGTVFMQARDAGRMSDETLAYAKKSLADAVDSAYGNGIISQETYQAWRKMLDSSFSLQLPPVERGPILQWGPLYNLWKALTRGGALPPGGYRGLYEER